MRSINNALLVTVFLFGATDLCSAQCNSQPPNGTYAAPANTTVYYKLDSSLASIAPGPGSPTVSSQIASAFAAWNTANQQSGSGTVFVQASGGQAASVTVTASQYDISGYASSTTAYSGVILPSNPATITLYPQSVQTNTATNLLQASAPGYNTAYDQIMLHEIGHVMGMDDYPSAPPFSSTASVMVYYSGVNDVGNNYQKTAPTACDASQTAANQKAIANAEQASGNGGDPGGQSGGTGNPDGPPTYGDGNGGDGGSGGCGSEPGFSNQCLVSAPYIS